MFSTTPFTYKVVTTTQPTYLHSPISVQSPCSVNSSVTPTLFHSRLKTYPFSTDPSKGNRLPTIRSTRLPTM